MKLSKGLMCSLVGAKDWLRSINKAFIEDRLDDSCGSWEVLAARYLALAVSCALRAALAAEDISFSAHESCEELVKKCRDYGVQIPSFYYLNPEVLNSYEFDAGYYIYFKLNLQEYVKLRDETQAFVDVLWVKILPMFIEEISKHIIVPNDMPLRGIYNGIKYLS